MAEILTDVVLLKELEPTAEWLLERHMASAVEWFPHDYIPYDEAKTFQRDYQWEPEDSEFSEAARSALYVNLLTEDNLPYYHHDIIQITGGEGVWGTWTRRWTAEEGRHSIAIRDYLIAKRAIDPTELERARMIQVSGGQTPEQKNTKRGMIYVALQELATRIAHSNTGRIMPDQAGKKVMARVAADENLHFIFYKDLCTAGFDLRPSEFTVTLEEVVKEFDMPGKGIPDFDKHSKLIAISGIYGATEFLGSVLRPCIEEWGVNKLGNLNSKAENAREMLNKRLARLEKLVKREKTAREIYKNLTAES